MRTLMGAACPQKFLARKKNTHTQEKNPKPFFQKKTQQQQTTMGVVVEKQFEKK